MGNVKSYINYENLELIKVKYITQKNAELNMEEFQFKEIDGCLRFNIDDDDDFFCNFSYDNQIRNTVLILNGTPIEFDDEKLSEFIILSCDKIDENIYQLNVKLSKKNEIDKLILNVNYFWKNNLLGDNLE